MTENIASWFCSCHVPRHLTTWLRYYFNVLVRHCQFSPRHFVLFCPFFPVDWTLSRFSVSVHVSLWHQAVKINGLWFYWGIFHTCLGLLTDNFAHYSLLRFVSLFSHIVEWVTLGTFRMYDGHGDGDDDHDPIDLFSVLVGIKTCPCWTRCACVQFQI